MGIFPVKFPAKRICSPKPNGRILKSDHSGRIYILPGQKRQTDGGRRVSVLSELKVGETGILIALDLPESVQNHLMHMGFVPEAHVTVLRRAPAGDPTVYGVDGMEIALRHETATAIRVRAADTVLSPDSADEAAGEADCDDTAVLPTPAELAEVAQ